jgi:hypothetical protein
MAANGRLSRNKGQATIMAENQPRFPRDGQSASTRWFRVRISVRALMFLELMIGVGLAWHLHRARKELTGLERIDLPNKPQLTGAFLQHVAELPKLTSLVLRGSGITDSSLAHLKRAKNLQSFYRTAIFFG